jgi:hypothetical protein
MENEYGGSGGLRFRRRFKAKSQPFSPSYGVRMGFIPNPHWPPPPGVEEGPERRTSVRIPLSFEIGLENGERALVDGNVSAGGAMFVRDLPMLAKQVDVYVQLAGETAETHAVGELIAVNGAIGTVIHRVRWVDPTVFADTASRLEQTTTARA